MQPDRELLQRLPKTDLHLHLDGSLRLSTLIDLARSRGVTLPATEPDELRRFVEVPLDCESLEQYLQAFGITVPLLQDAEALARVAFELAEDLHRENVLYAEVRYSPLLHRDKGMSMDEVVGAVERGLARARDLYGIRCGQILCGIRHISPESSLELADCAVRWNRRGVVGFDLAGAEKDYPAKEHREAFRRVRCANMGITIHAGEAFGPASVHQALHWCGARRIGHGVRLAEDPDLLEYVNDHRIPLEMCPTSNVQTKAVTRYADHPLPRFLELGLRVTVNTDNRLVSGTTSTDELLVCVREFGLDLEHVVELVVAGFKSSFLPLPDKIHLLDDVFSRLRALGIDNGREIARRRRTAL